MNTAVFREMTADTAVTSLPLSHLSVEVGHLYMEDFALGLTHLTRMFRRVAPWSRTASAEVDTVIAPKRPRVSTCFLIDDYFSPLSPPDEVLPMVRDAAAAAELTIDYVARESACATADGRAIGEIVADRLVADPPPGASGSRPSTHDSGWLCNGVRSPRPPDSGQAMRAPVQWRPPSENGANRHSIFVDVELWADRDNGRTWSCAFLSAVWQLLRLGVLRFHGEPVIVPQLCRGTFPSSWSEVPALLQLEPNAAPFTAYRTFSVLANRFLPVEHAVRMILSQFAVERQVMAQVSERAAAEGLDLPMEIVDRIEYAFAGTRWN